MFISPADCWRLLYDIEYDIRNYIKVPVVVVGGEAAYIYSREKFDVWQEL